MIDYKFLVKKITPKENVLKNCLVSFFSGGFVGMISYILVNYFDSNIMLIFWICLSSILTGFGIMDKLIKKFRMGLIIPITGFAHSITASALEYKNEGLITGIGSNYFKLAGSVILYGLVSSAFFSILGELIKCI